MDDLHEAEDQIGALRDVLANVVARWDASAARGLFGGTPLGDAIAAARLALVDNYCRPSCSGWRTGLNEGDGVTEEDGCPDTCGCPCHNGEETDIRPRTG